MLKYRLSLGKYLGIGLYVHWTFSLLLAFAAFQSWDQGSTAVAFLVTIICSVFFCVTLHEYGHSMAARRFGIPTVDITLFPIGGVARLERMPRIPWQELVVAVAGPAVNVVIATILGIVLYSFGVFDGIEFVSDTGSAVVSSESVVADGQAVTTPALAAEQAAAESASPAEDELLAHPSLLNYLFVMFAANTMLVLFNMVPAFPMDGGRVLRSLLAMVMNYRKATFIASRIGLLCAAGMIIFWVSQGQPHEHFTIVLVSMFVAYAGIAEAKQVDVMETVRGLTVGDVMVGNPTTISMDASLEEIAYLWRTSSATALPVLSYVGTVIGILTPRKFTEAMQATKAVSDSDSATKMSAGQIADHSVPTVYAGSKLEDVIMSVGRGQRQIPVVDSTQQLVGLLDLDAIRWRGPLSKMTNVSE